MNQVEDDVDAASGAAEGLGAQHVALVEGEAAPLEVRCPVPVTDQAADVPTGGCEGGCEACADEAGGSGYQCVAARARKLTSMRAVVAEREAGASLPIELPLDRVHPPRRERALACEAFGDAACVAGWEPPGLSAVITGRVLERLGRAA